MIQSRFAVRVVHVLQREALELVNDIWKYLLREYRWLVTLQPVLHLVVG